MGGLARRASVLNTWRDTQQAFTVAGAYELNRPGNRAQKSSVTTFHRTFGHLGYDLGVLTGGEAAQLKTVLSGPEADNPIPPGWMQFSDQAQTKIFTHHGLRLGFIILPHTPGPQGQNTSGNGQMPGLEEAIRSLKSSCDLSIGLSPWGWQKEKEFLESGSPVPDILLGSGSGPAILGKLANNAHTVWLRPYSQGRALNAISIPDPQAKDWVNGWRIEKNIHLEFLVLDDRVPSDPDIQELLTSGSR